jgi:hypothetical protein
MSHDQNQINIGAGVTWNAVQGNDAAAFFPDYAPGQNVPRSVGKAFHNADPKALLASLDPTDITNGTGRANVYAVANNPNLVVKLSREPFSNTAVNALLSEAWDTHPQLSTPRYLGYLASERLNATLMTRVKGHQIADSPHELTPQGLEIVRERIKTAGQIALQGFGIDPGVVAWDLTSRNIYHDGTDLATHPSTPLIVIDQDPTHHVDAYTWSAMHANKPTRDLRDISAQAATADQAAFDKFFERV